MTDELAAHLLDRDQASSWCADHDPTGRYVCARIRDHALDWHAARNGAGGIHQWPSAVPTAASELPVYGVAPDNVHRDDVVTAKELWEAIKPQFDPNDAWEYTELGPLLRTFVAVLDRRRAEIAADAGVGDLRQQIVTELDGMVSEFIHPNEFGGYDVDYGDLADIALAVVQPVLEHQAAELQQLRAANASLLAMLERMETLHVTFHGPDGEEYHPDWCRECRVDKVRAELADMRASREAWAMEATSQDGLADRFLVWYSRVYDAVSQAAKLPPSQTVDDVVEAVGRLGRERDTAVVALASDRIVYCDKPEDRLWHASDRTWWRRAEDGRLVRGEAPLEVERLTRERDDALTALDDLERQRDAWWNQRAAERDRLAGLLRGMARRAGILRRERNLARSSRDQYRRNWDRCREANGTALQTISALKLERVVLSGLLRGMARRASGQRRSKERLAMWAEGSRPAVPADATEVPGER